MAALALTFSACSDDEGVEGSGEASVEITDAPIDNAEVQGVFVTITDVKINGQSASSFNGKTTVDLLALQNGRTELLAKEELNAGTYNNITFTLDLATDASGNAPGSYVMTSSGKQALEMDGQTEVDLTASGSYSILANASSALVVDFDLRKMIKSETSSGSDKYSFVTRGEAQSSLRLVEKRASGTVSGQVDMSSFDDADKVIVYAYKRGEFNRDAETSGQGSSNIKFANAISSTAVVEGALSNSFELNFLESGEYDLVFAAYSENTLTGELELEGFLETNAGIEGQIANTIAVEANAEVNISFSIRALID
ncbi:MAG: hypothetical protein Roseis2KO_02510 [Roseivirga sp.]